MDNGRFGHDMMSRWFFGSSDEDTLEERMWLGGLDALDSMNDNFKPVTS